MGQNELGMLLVLAVACAIIGISYLHKRRAQPFVDRFAQTYCETVSYVLGDMGEYRDARLATEETESGNLRSAPLEQQSRPIRMLLEKGVDERTIELLRAMFEQHGQVNKRLSGLNLLGKREPGVYGTGSYDDLCRELAAYAAALDIRVDIRQSNHEGALIDEIQAADGVYDGIVINPGAYTHYSYAIYDALLAVSVPAVEVHLSDINRREPFRRVSVTAPACRAQIVGHGFLGYMEAINLLAGKEPQV